MARRRGPRIGTGAGLADAPVVAEVARVRRERRERRAADQLAKLGDATDLREPWERLGLTWAQECFCRERVADPEAPAVHCAMRVEAWAGRSRGALGNVSHNLLRKPAVQARIATLRREALAAVERRRRTKLTSQRVLDELTALGTSDLRDLVDVGPDGTVTVRPTSEWPDRAAAAVASVTQTPDGVKLTLHDKPASLGKLAKILKLVPEPSAGIPGAGVVIGRAVVYIPDNGRDPELLAAPEPVELPPPASQEPAPEEPA